MISILRVNAGRGTMKGKLMFGAGLGAGYLMWSRKGQAAFQKFKDQAGAFWQSPSVQHQVHDVTETVKHKAPEVMDKVTTAAKKATDAAGSFLPGTHESHADSHDSPTEPNSTESHSTGSP